MRTSEFMPGTVFILSEGEVSAARGGFMDAEAHRFH
jgi:hypothetical protein